MKDQHKNGTNKAARQLDKHHAWNGGRFINPKGYVRILVNRGEKSPYKRYQDEHIVVAEKMLGRKLKSNECVHHIDEDRQNNSPENLQVMTRAEHSAHHGMWRAAVEARYPGVVVKRSKTSSV